MPVSLCQEHPFLGESQEAVEEQLFGAFQEHPVSNSQVVRRCRLHCHLIARAQRRPHAASLHAQPQRAGPIPTQYLDPCGFPAHTFSLYLFSGGFPPEVNRTCFLYAEESNRGGQQARFGVHTHPNCQAIADSSCRLNCQPTSHGAQTGSGCPQIVVCWQSGGGLWGTLSSELSWVFGLACTSQSHPREAWTRLSTILASAR